MDYKGSAQLISLWEFKMVRKPVRDMQKENLGWFQLAILILLFPALFFLCVYFPIWVGLTPQFP